MSRSARGRPRILAAACAAALGLLAASAAPAPALPPPLDLRVDSGEAWRPLPRFVLSWRLPAGVQPSALRYRLRDSSGLRLREGMLSPEATRINPFETPAVPGVYRAEVSLLDAAGEEGPVASALLRFDDTRPGRPRLAAPQGWIGRTSFPLRLPLGPAAGPLPPAGVRGFAVAVARTGEPQPCGGAARCEEADLSLVGSTGTLRLLALPEGSHQLAAVAVSGSGMRSANPVRAELRVDTTDPVTRLVGAPAGWADGPVRLVAQASDGGAGMRPDGVGPAPFTAISVDGAQARVAAGERVEATVFGEGVHEIAYYARDAAGNVNDGGHGNGLQNHPPGRARVRIDLGAPRLAFAPPDPADPELIRVATVDQLSGADPASGTIEVRPAGSREAFRPLPTVAAAGGELRARWDSEAERPGEYEFRASVADAAGNRGTTTRRGDGARMVLRAPLKAAAELSAGLGARRAALKVTPYGSATLLAGTLRAGGTPLGGNPIQVIERLAPDGTVRISRAVTGPGGGFALRLAAGPSREVSVSFAGSAAVSRALAPPLRVRVRGRVRFGASARTARVGGRPLRFYGQVAAPAGTVPRGGLAVQLQFRLPGQDWEEFRTVRTDRRGRFLYPYRFSDDDSRGVTFLFRARAPAQSGWPYEPAGSRPIAVRGR